ncbi:glycoside hydrolase/deacetylase [Wallemia mellicola CBS 633.66]|uniref:Glycoside hydrolase/deacetylase n=1 Tax=Wallemia mellicola (strain ATCC MYA-4683 / CBS 633.66) TaxID=671144 RepID=I4YJF1_WALMC|nr:glycoside hydrolase/deacetylase [Wallemia mellicola CBS 633.66]EIM24093.1 glycoside hydrolase/deacetylase [Wallemia mellicola CBS 633.66]|eukprot:XP_006955919.1 glycoside hydrolase/deacetylase [Wallemia mellicola CBS 633.66]
MLNKVIASAVIAAVAASPLTSRQDQGTSAVFNCNHDFALTYDDGPYTYGNELTDSFSNAGHLYTRFLNGNNWRCIYDEDMVQNIQYAHSKGHLIGSHGWSHASFNDITREQLDSEIDNVDEALKKILGIVPKYVRPPYGTCDASCVDYLQAKGKTVVQWSEDSGDSAGVEPSEIISKIQGWAADGKPHLILDHEVYQSSVEEVVPAVLPSFDGKKLTTVAECIDAEPYLEVSAPGTRDDTWTCSNKPPIKATPGSSA